MLKHFNQYLGIGVAALLIAACGPKAEAPVPANAPYKNSRLSAERRADDLLKRMTLEEKLGQLLCPLGWPMYEKVSADSVEAKSALKSPNISDGMAAGAGGGGGSLSAKLKNEDAPKEG